MLSYYTLTYHLTILWVQWCSIRMCTHSPTIYNSVGSMVFMIDVYRLTINQSVFLFLFFYVCSHRGDIRAHPPRYFYYCTLTYMLLYRLFYHLTVLWVPDWCAHTQLPSYNSLRAHRSSRMRCTDTLTYHPAILRVHWRSWPMSTHSPTIPLELSAGSLTQWRSRPYSRHRLCAAQDDPQD